MQMLGCLESGERGAEVQRLVFITGSANASHRLGVGSSTFVFKLELLGLSGKLLRQAVETEKALAYSQCDRTRVRVANQHKNKLHAISRLRPPLPPAHAQ